MRSQLQNLLFKAPYFKYFLLINQKYNLQLRKKFSSFDFKSAFVNLNRIIKQLGAGTTTTQKKVANKRFLAGLAACGVFSWDDYRITNAEVKEEIIDILKAFEKEESSDQANTHRINFEKAREFEDEAWKKIYDKKDLIIWRRKIDHDPTTATDIFEHKVLGRVQDITPLEYFRTQLNLEFRPEWDYLVLLLKMVEKDSETNTELIRWVSKFPYPLNPREYVYVRRSCIEPNEKLLVLLSRGLPECQLPYDDIDPKNVRITQYKSNMIIIPHSDFDKPGIYYIIQYYDVNKAKIPKLAYKYMATSGLPDYVNKLHKATLKLRSKTEKNNEKDFLADFHFFDIKRENEKPASDRSASESEINMYEAPIEQKRFPDKSDAEIPLEKHDNEGASENASQLSDDDIKIPIILMETVRKLNQDYFNECEPHPVFFNY